MLGQVHIKDTCDTCDTCWCKQSWDSTIDAKNCPSQRFTDVFQHVSSMEFADSWTGAWRLIIPKLRSHPCSKTVVAVFLRSIKGISRDAISLAFKTSWSAVLHDGARVKAFDGFADLKVFLTELPQDEYALNVLDVQCQSFADVELSRLGI